MYYISSCSGGKDSCCSLLMNAIHGDPLHEVMYCEVMFDHGISGEIPEHRDFIYDRLIPFCEKDLGVKFTVLRSDKTYYDATHFRITRGPHQGKKRGFVYAGMCFANRDLKMPPIKQYVRSLPVETITYVGIAADEPRRLARLEGTAKVSLLAKYGITETDAMQLCREYGLLSPIYDHMKRNGCWFCPNASDAELSYMIEHHPELFKRLIEWEHEENVFNRRLTRTETPSEIFLRLSNKNNYNIAA